MTEPIEVFLSYSHQDDELRQELSSHLSSLTRQKLIKPWHDRAIDAGSEWAQEIAQNLEHAEIIVLLVSADFMNSDYCYGVELKRALERHQAQSVRVISVIIRDCDWEESPLGELQAIPGDGQVVANGRDKHGRDQYWRQVSKEVRKAAEQIRDRKLSVAKEQAQLHQNFRDKALAIYQEYYQDGALPTAAKSLLKKVWKDLGLTESSAQKILQDVEQHHEHLAEYRSVFVADLSEQGDLTPAQRRSLSELQNAFGLGETEVKQIEEQVLADRTASLEGTTLGAPAPLLPSWEKRSAPVGFPDHGSGVRRGLGDEGLSLPFLEMVQIPGGSFLMGSPDGQGNDNERPQHQVKVPGFFMGKYPVTQAQWRSVAALPTIEISLESEPSIFKGADLPVENITWYQAVEFCQRLSHFTSFKYRLPSEAEWEYACRANTETNFCFGDALDANLANFNQHVGKTTVVDTYPPNAFGLYDMHGNVWEWCQDHWHKNYQGASTDGSAWVNIAEQNNTRVLRGGSWIGGPNGCRSAFRDGNYAVNLIFNRGFRVVYSPARTL